MGKMVNMAFEGKTILGEVVKLDRTNGEITIDVPSIRTSIRIVANIQRLVRALKEKTAAGDPVIQHNISFAVFTEPMENENEPIVTPTITSINGSEKREKRH